MDRKYCSGCYNDFYNDRGGCWHLKDARLVQRIRIHRDAMPPYLAPVYKPEQTPQCWQGQNVTAYNGDILRADGYWK
jgi:hypothetical protein